MHWYPAELQYFKDEELPKYKVSILESAKKLCSPKWKLGISCCWGTYPQFYIKTSVHPHPTSIHQKPIPHLPSTRNHPWSRRRLKGRFAQAWPKPLAEQISSDLYKWVWRASCSRIISKHRITYTGCFVDSDFFLMRLYFLMLQVDCFELLLVGKT